MQNNDRKKTKSAPSRFALAVMVCALVALFAIVLTRQQEPSHVKVRIHAGREYRLEKADTEELRTKGLSARKMLHPNEGMLFVYERTGTRCIWMKDMQFPIDIAWLDASKRVTVTEQRVFPSTYPRKFCHRGQYVIELPIGALHDVAQGKQLSF